MKRLLSIILITIAVPFLSFIEPENDPDVVNRVIIDAGHGGKDSGTSNLSGPKTYEKDVALKVALMVGKYIEENLPDVEVIYTRKTDVFLELWERTQLANRVQGDVFISIHCNGVARSDAYGTETWTIGMHKTAAQLEVAKRENSVILLEDNYEEKYTGFNPSQPESYIALSLNQRNFIDQSLELATNIQYEFRERVSRRDRGVKQAGFYVISRTVMPSVLVELGFLSNPTEKEFLKSQSGQEYMASAIYRAFKKYKINREKGLNKNPSDKEEMPAQKVPEDAVITEKDVKSEKEEAPKSDLIYSVQLSTLSKRVSPNSPVFKGLKPIRIEQVNELYKYLFGACGTMKEATLLQSEAREKGFNSSFVVAYYKGQRISIDEARTYEGLE